MTNILEIIEIMIKNTNFEISSSSIKLLGENGSSFWTKDKNIVDGKIFTFIMNFYMEMSEEEMIFIETDG